MDRYEYMKIPLDIFPQSTQDQYELEMHAHNGFIYVDIRKAIYGLPQAGILGNILLRKQLCPAGWKHTTRPIQFMLTVDDFRVKYVGKEHAHHLISTLRQHYDVEEDWDGTLYCGITLNWNYVKQYANISMPGYVD